MRIHRSIVIGLAAVALGGVLGLVLRGREQALAIQAASADLSARRVRSAAPLVIARRAPASALSGRVVDEHSQPIGGAEVCALRAGSDPTALEAQHCVRSDHAGAFSFVELLPMAYRVSASAAGFTPALAEAGRLIAIAADSPHQALEIMLGRSGVELSGQVLDATGGSVPGARVRIVHWTSPPIVAHTEADADGRFSAFIARGSVSLTASADGYASASVSRVAPSSDIELMLTPAATVLGRVVTADESERPVAGAEVTITAERHAQAAASATTSADGSFELHGLEPGSYFIGASAPGYRGYAPDSLPIALGETVRDVKIAVVPGAQVSGRVEIVPERSPCLEGIVRLGSRPPENFIPPSLKASLPPADPKRDARGAYAAAIGAAGAVQLDAVPPGRYFAMVDCRGYQPLGANVVVEVGTEDSAGFVWEVERGLALAIKVVDGSSQPVPDAQVRLTWPATAGESARTMVIPMNGNGVFETPGNLDAGTYRIEALHYAADPLEIELMPGMGRVEALLRLRGTAAIVVKLKSAAGAAIDAAAVVARATPAQGSERSSAFAAASQGLGVYRTGPLNAGHYAIEVTDGVNPPIELTTSVASGETREVELALDRSGWIGGHVADERGAALADAWVSVIDERANDRIDDMMRAFTAPARRALSDESGRFMLTGLDPSGTYTVSGSGPSGGESGSQSGIRPGVEIKLQLMRQFAEGPDHDVSAVAQPQ
jgi:protocatechuate 3,4-dioxygenase beta subunit